MQLVISEKPAEKTGKYISQRLRDAEDSDVLVLLSGGSALSVLDFVDEFSLGEQVTFMMMDERFSDDSTVNNYLQFTANSLFEKVTRRHAQIIDTAVKKPGISLQEAALSINRTLKYLYKVKPDMLTIGLFGIGEDGHTASIFPKQSEDEFNALYRTNELFIPIVEESNPYPERMTITPYFIKNYISEVIIFATGESKCTGVLEKVTSTDGRPYEIPARIPQSHPRSYLFCDCMNLVSSIDRPDAK